ncbi:MAG: IS21 family transposase [Pseudobdellovibrionaceae bacterium]
MDRKIVEKFRAGISASQISNEFSKGKGYVIKIRDLAVEYGFLEQICDKPKLFKSTNRILPDFPEALFPIQDLRSTKPIETDKLLDPQKPWILERLNFGWSPQTIFEELGVSVPRANFYRYLERYHLKSDRILRGSSLELVHAPGECLQVDWAKMFDVTGVDGKKRTIWAFIGVLGHSRYTVVRAMDKCDFKSTVIALQSMLLELGGVPRKITSDNPKVFVTEASNHEPLLNAGYERFASQTGFTIEALPPADPQKKGKVERTVQLIRRLFESFDMNEFSLEKAQTHIDLKLKIANSRKHGSHGEKPVQVFEEQEKQSLKPLPEVPYEIETITIATIRQDGYVRFLNKYYRVDQRLKGQDATVIGNNEKLAIYCGGRLLEVYDVIKDKFQRQTCKEHYKQAWEKDLQNHAHYIKLAESIGGNVARIVQIILARGEGFIDTRVIWGVLTLNKKYLAKDIDTACSSAIEIGSISLKTIHMFLKLAPTVKTTNEKFNTTGGKFTRPMSEYRAHLRLVK